MTFYPGAASARAEFQLAQRRSEESPIYSRPWPRTVFRSTPALTGSATTAGKGRRNSDRWQTYRNGSDESWRSYPFYNETYKGCPVSEWLRPGTW
jgi:hypothetical protein